MQIVSYKSVLDLFTDLVGAIVGQVQTVDSDTFNRLFNRVIRRAWEFYFWPDLMLLEQRYYRDAWAAQAYASQAEVFYTATAGSYWRANAITTGADIPGTSAKWDLITVLDAYVGSDQTGKTPIGTVKAVWNANFRTTRPAYKLAKTIDERGVALTGNSVPTSCWIHFRQRCPSWKGANFDATLVYPIGKTRYYTSDTEGFEGDFWTTSAVTVAGESPETTPAKWVKMPVPAFLCDFAANGVKLGWLEGDGQLEKALADAQSDLWTHLYDEMDKFEAQSGQARTARVANV